MFHFLSLRRPKPQWLSWLQLGPDVIRLFLFFSFYFTSKAPFLSHLLSLTRMERSSDGKGVEEKQGVAHCARWKYVGKALNPPAPSPKLIRSSSAKKRNCFSVAPCSPSSGVETADCDQVKISLCIHPPPPPQSYIHMFVEFLWLCLDFIYG